MERVLLILLLVGAREAYAGGLAGLLTELYGGDGISLAPTGEPVEHAPHFSAGSLDRLNSFGDELTSALGVFSLNSTVSSYTFDLELGVPVRTTESLGPIVSERATTMGARRLNLGFSYNRVDFKRFEGDELDDITLRFPHQDINEPPDGILGPNPSIGFTSDVETDLVRVDLNIDLDQDIFTFYGTYGLLRNLDLSVAIPIVQADLKAKADASVERHAECVNPPDCDIMSDDVHNFDPSVGDPVSSFVKGDSTGIGDVLLRGKYNFLRGHEWAPNLAFLGQVKLPTGDDDDLLGTGDTRGMAMFVADRTYGFVSPHLNLGFELVGGNSGLHNELNNLKYYVGFDARLHKRVTTVFDVLGRWEPSGDGIGDHLLDSAIGGKFNVIRSLVLVVNFIVPLNRNEGLRPDFVWALGMEYTFGGVE